MVVVEGAQPGRNRGGADVHGDVLRHLGERLSPVARRTSITLVTGQASGVTSTSPRPTWSAGTPRRLSATRFTGLSARCGSPRLCSPRTMTGAADPVAEHVQSIARATVPAVSVPVTTVPAPVMVNDAVHPQPQPAVGGRRGQSAEHVVQRRPQVGQAGAVDRGHDDRGRVAQSGVRELFAGLGQRRGAAVRGPVGLA